MPGSDESDGRRDGSDGAAPATAPSQGEPAGAGARSGGSDCRLRRRRRRGRVQGGLAPPRHAPTSTEPAGPASRLFDSRRLRSDPDRDPVSRPPFVPPSDPPPALVTRIRPGDFGQFLSGGTLVSAFLTADARARSLPVRQRRVVRGLSASAPDALTSLPAAANLTGTGSPAERAGRLRSSQRRTAAVRRGKRAPERRPRTASTLRPRRPVLGKHEEPRPRLRPPQPRSRAKLRREAGLSIERRQASLGRPARPT